MGVDWDTALKRDMELVSAAARKKRNARIFREAGTVVEYHKSGHGAWALAMVKAWPKQYRILVSLQTRMFLGERL